MSIQAETPRVHLGIHALQYGEPFRWYGLGRYVRELTLQLLRDHRELIAGLHFAEDQLIPAALADFCGLGLLQQSPQASERRLDEDGRPQIFHVMSPFTPFPAQTLFPPAFRHGGAKLVVTLHDLIPYIYPDAYLSDPLVRRIYLSQLRLIQEADWVLAISQTTREDAIRLLGLDPERIVVTSEGVSDFFQPPETAKETVLARIRKRLPQIRGAYVLYVAGASDPRKNIRGAIQAHARLPDGLSRTLQLVIIGSLSDRDRGDLQEVARREGVEQALVFAGFVPDDLLRDLYQACEIFIFPSLYEGFGLPILEAMRCGAPVVASDRSSMKELIEMERARFDPQDASDIARVMGEALTDTEFQRGLREYGLSRSRQFTWQRAAQATADAYRALTASAVQRPSHALPRRRLVAFCTPFPPQQSGVADYFRSLIEPLCARHPVKVDVVVRDDPETYVPPDQKAVSLISIRQFRWLADHGHYDTIVYCMGNNSLHDYVYELLKERPGVVWLHDVSLTDFYQWYYRQAGRDVSRLPEELLPWASRYPDYQGDVLLRDTVTQHQHGVYLSGEVASYAQKIVVNSRFSKELVEIESGGRVPVVVIPHAAPPVSEASLHESWPQLAAKYGLDQRATVLVSIGVTGPTQCSEVIIDGFAAAAVETGNTVLAFIGAFEPGYQRELEHRVSQCGIGDRVRFTGYVDEAELGSWLAAARCAIQLRIPSNGDSSAAVTRCLAAGVPTIVTDHGPLRDLPDDAVVKLPAPVEPATLADALLRLLSDDPACEGLRRGALRYARQVSFEAVADQFWTEVLCIGSNAQLC